MAVDSLRWNGRAKIKERQSGDSVVRGSWQLLMEMEVQVVGSWLGVLAPAVRSLGISLTFTWARR